MSHGLSLIAPLAAVCGKSRDRCIQAQIEFAPVSMVADFRGVGRFKSLVGFAPQPSAPMNFLCFQN